MNFLYICSGFIGTLVTVYVIYIVIKSDKANIDRVDRIIEDFRSRKLYTLNGTLPDGSTIHIQPANKIEDVTFEMLQEYINEQQRKNQTA